MRGKITALVIVTALVLAAGTWIAIRICGGQAGSNQAPPPFSAQVRVDQGAPPNAPFHATVIRDGKVVETFPFAFMKDVTPDEIVEIRPNRDVLRKPVLAVRVLGDRAGGELAFTPETLHVTADGRPLAPPHVLELRKNELIFEVTYEIPADARAVRLRTNKALRLAIKMAESPVRWDMVPREFLRPNPLGKPRFAGKSKQWIDYFYFGAYQHSYRGSLIERCSRQDDFLVIYVDPARFAKPLLSVRIVRFTDSNLSRLRADHFVVSTGPNKLTPQIIRDRKQESEQPLVQWKLPAGVKRLVVEVKVPARYQLAVSDGPVAWRNISFIGSQDAPPIPTTREDATVRVAPSNNEPCFP
ncbi:MAG: hypothetical protein P9L99_11280 [Candidatus Lernaella stagnicola]|nr:hypothetical protein [Candidatus Lernaella stagnicola]